MTRKIMRVVTWLAVTLATGVTAASLLAVVFPWFDLLNHFRPFLLLGLTALTVGAMALKSSLASIAAAVVLLLNVALTLLPMLFSAEAATHPSLRVATFNVWVQNDQPKEVARFLLQTKADIVVLQEVDARLEAALVLELSNHYPHVKSCADRNCGLMLLSKQPWSSSGSSDRKPHSPPVIWARFGEGPESFVVTGLHLAWPFQPNWQGAQIEWLKRTFQDANGTQILVGDFNLTPLSWKLNYLSAAAGLRRHATFAASWPAHRIMPFVLLDNLLATPDVNSADVVVADQGYGSDHRAVIFDVALPGRN